MWTSSTDNVAVVGYRIYANSIDGVANGAVLYDGPANSAGLTDSGSPVTSPRREAKCNTA
ncbi:MAG: hypothetical protein R2710_19135 [Acidimicrobiales bacterium]